MEPEVYETFSSVEDHHWWFSARRQFIRRLIERFIVTDEAAVYCEVGCGTGGNLPMLAETATVDAVEMDAYGLQCVRDRSVEGVRTIQAGFLPDGLPVTGPYRAVFSLDVLEHLEDDSAAARAMADLLQDQGVLLITVPAYQWMWSYHDEINQHVRRYSRTEVIRIVEQAGLQVVYSSHFNTILAPLAIGARAWEKLVGVFRQPQKSVGLALPPRWLNRILEEIFGLERFLAGRLSIPFGLSIVVVATKVD
jgi:2-polyprenyl-3-methyl-5-hydroxy-6-metoxy-1,4-benzoquinol methylase